jgi:hypothetical protein
VPEDGDPQISQISQIEVEQARSRSLYLHNLCNLRIELPYANAVRMINLEHQ